MTTPRLAIRAHDTQTDVPPGKQTPGKRTSGHAGSARARSFRTEAFDLAETGRPGLQAAMSPAAGRDRPAAQTSAQPIDRGRDMTGRVGIHADDGLGPARPLRALARASNGEDRTVMVRDRQAPKTSHPARCRGTSTAGTSMQ